MTPTQFIIIAAIVLIMLGAAYIVGYWNGRDDEREEMQIKQRQRQRRLMVVHCPKNGPQTKSDWSYYPSTRAA